MNNTVDLERLCRMCASSCDSIDALHLHIFPGSSLASKLHNYLDIKLADDDQILPQQVCQSCYDVLNFWEENRRIVKKAQIFYKRQLALRNPSQFLQASQETSHTKIASMFPQIKEPIYECSICHEFFDNLDCLRDHQQTQHDVCERNTDSLASSSWNLEKNPLAAPLNNGHPESTEWRPRFSFSVSLAEILYNWGFLRRKSCQHTELPNSVTRNALENLPGRENIELCNFNGNEVPVGLTNSVVQSQLQTPTCTLLSSSPIHLSTSSLFCDAESQPVTSPIAAHLNSSSLKSFLWEEVPGLESGMGHEFFASDVCYPTWCDRCGDLLWGLQGEYLRCQSKWIEMLDSVFHRRHIFVYSV